MTFRVGQPVECVEGCSNPTWYLEKGKIYIVSDVGLFCDRLHVDLEGFPPSPLGPLAFRASRFRPIVERKTDISIFTAMLTPSKRSVDA